MPHNTEGRVNIVDKKTDQGHFVIGGIGVPAKDDSSYATKILSALTGGMMSSRMFLNVREKLGICYYISTSTDDFTDIGLISTRAGVDVSRLITAVKAILQEYEILRNNEISEKELNKSKNFMIGKMKLRMEDTENCAHMLGKQNLMYDEVLSLAEIEKKIKDVGLGDISTIANKLYDLDNMYISAIGPFSGKKEELKSLLTK